MSSFFRNRDKKQVSFAIAKQGYNLIFIFGFITLIFAMIGFATLAFLGLLITIFIIFFFWDPSRIIPEDEKAIVSPADGKIVFAGVVDNNPYTKESCLKVSIFMSVFNVHVNRIPFSGKILNIRYFPGKFFNASFDKASEKNERNAIIIETKCKKKYCVVQIAGLIAKRIICNVIEYDEVEKGKRFGIICFGSRLDVYLPIDTTLNVQLADKVKAGSSILGYFS